ncbi:MAG: HAMP domain-containing sensor histidine kinase [Pseudomonadota bacterium]
MNEQSARTLRPNASAIDGLAEEASRVVGATVGPAPAPELSWFEIAPFACLRVTAEGLIAAANEQAHRVLRSRKDLQGQRLSDIFDGPEALYGPGRGWQPLICLPMKAAMDRLVAVPRQRHFRYLSAHPIVGGPESGMFYLHLWPAPSQDLAAALPAPAEDALAVSAISAHDLKSPLRHISMALEFLEEDIRDDLADTSWLELARDSTQQLQTLVDDILSHARGGHAPLRLETLRLRRAIQVPLSALSLLIEESGAEIAIDLELESLMADPVLFRVLIQNLLENALKYRDEARPLTVSFASGHHPGGGGWLSVADTGIGFPPERAEEIFEPFHQLGSRGGDGSGIGLATCRTICQRHGWRIRAEGRPGHGATFVIDIPA